jgi:hypothetical protein
MFIKPTLTFLFILSLFNIIQADLFDDFLRDPKYAQNLNERIKYLLELEPNYFNYTLSKTFDCNETTSNTTTPDSVHKLRPTDIKLIGAIGDSLTAGWVIKATSIYDLFNESRGRTFSVGGKLCFVHT